MQGVLANRRAFFFPLLAFFSVYLFVLSAFEPFLSAYGDVQEYVGNDKFRLWNYQPVWPYVAGNLFKHFGIAGLFYFQAALYFVSAVALYFSIFQISKRIAIILLVFMVINARAYFYIANPTTEIFNLFLFSVGIVLFVRLGRNRSGIIWLLCALTLFIIGFSRSANVVFLVILSGLLLLKTSFGFSRKNFLVAIPALVASLAFNLALQNKPNNTGINLLRFIHLACDSDIKTQVACSPMVFESEKSPIAKRYYAANQKIAGIEMSYESKGLNVWAPEFSREMKIIYLRLLMFSPNNFFLAATKNYEQHFSDTYVPPYPEDVNKEILQLSIVKFIDHFSTALSLLAGLLAPLLFLFFIMLFLLKKHLTEINVFLVSWLGFELLTSYFLFANLWVSDASRMRFHYELPALTLILLTARHFTRSELFVRS